MDMAHQGGKKTNPRRKPCSVADLNRAKDKATREAVHLAMAIFLMVLKDDFDFTLEQVQHAWDRLDKLSEEVAEHRINASDLILTLRDEYGIDLR